MADWVSIRTEYVTTQISTRALAQKYGVSYSALEKRCRKEQWAAERGKAAADVRQKTVEAISNAQFDRVSQLMEGTQKAAALLMKRLDQMDEDGKIKVYEIKAITEAFKNVRDLYESGESSRSDTESDGLTEALNAAAKRVCTGEDDSAMLPEVDDGEEEGG